MNMLAIADNIVDRGVGGAGGGIYGEREPWQRSVMVSGALHVAFFLLAFGYAAYVGRSGRDNWGGTTAGDGAMSATLVSSVSIPLPQNEAPKENIVANESKGVDQTPPKEAEQDPAAIPLPDRDAKLTPKKNIRSITPEKLRPVQRLPKPDNVVPFGEGGPVSGPYAVFNAGNAKGGFSFTGGGGDFGSRYGWYVDVVRRKVSENWLRYEVEPGIANARRVYLTFDILRNGQPANVQISQSSGVPSLDQSAVRALQRIDNFGPLPNDYPGGKVSVEFWFDYRK